MHIKIGHKLKVILSFGGFGLLNNLLYVVILSAAVDLVGTQTPKSVVLLADVVPAFLLKLVAPFFIQKISYAARIATLVALSFLGMQLIANVASLPVRLVGIMMASASSGLGEITFLQLTHYYNQEAIHGWSTGTGGAGLAGSFVFMVMTSWLQIPTPYTLMVFSLMPFLVAVIYLWGLPTRQQTYQPVSPSSRSRPVIEKLKGLVLPYIVPLTLVYISEYIINQGISPTLLFPLDEMPFRDFRDAYVTYGTLYQLGVFISRSSGMFFRVRNLYLSAILQVINLGVAVLQSMFMVLPSVWLLMIFVVYEGLLGGLAYVNTFMLVSESVSAEEREFAMGAVAVSDSTGIVVAGLISLWLEKALCRYQIGTGRPWCELP